jgi:hypothetical protein
MQNVPSDNPHMWIPNHGPKPFEEVCGLCGAFRYAIRKQRPEPPASALPCPEPWPQSNMTGEDIAALKAQSEHEGRAAGKGGLYDERGTKGAERR